MKIKKYLKYILIALVILSALLGITVVFRGSLMALELKVLMTALTVMVFSVLGLACSVYLDQNKEKILPIAGIAFAGLSAMMWIFQIWSNAVWAQEWRTNLQLSLPLFAISCSHLSLISLVKLEGKLIWLRYIITASIWSLTAILLYLIWNDQNPEGLFLRLIAVLCIVIASLTALTPIFHKR
jgi:hypothetical protein